MNEGYTIELARRDDLAALPAIERAAEALFEGTGLLPETAEDTTADAEFAEAQAEGRLFVARAPTGEPVGFALVHVHGGEPHLEEMDVDPAHGRRGLGRRLLEAVFEWGRSQGHARVTLTTFRDLAWNAPFYAKAGFGVLPLEEITGVLAEIVQDEAARGLDPAQRVVMSRSLEPGG